MQYTVANDTKIVPVRFWIWVRKELFSMISDLHADKIVIITDSHVRKLHGDDLSSYISDIPHQFFEFPAGESHKNLETYQALCEDILDSWITKKAVVIALWWGVVGNIAWFVAATLFRGLRFVQMPTTVMAQADASTGGKQAVNTRHGKNTIGTFYEPECILVDPHYLTTLDAREIRCGIAECIKHALCQKPLLLETIWAETNNLAILSKIVQETIELKCIILNQDRQEHSLWKTMVYGHTIWHAIEMIALSQDRPLTHGEAISIGMCVAARTSEKLGLSENELLAKHERAFKQWNLPVRLPKSITPDLIIQQLRYDKKFMDSDIELVLMKHPWEMIITSGGSWSVPVNVDMIRQVLRDSY